MLSLTDAKAQAEQALLRFVAGYLQQGVTDRVNTSLTEAVDAQAAYTIALATALTERKLETTTETIARTLDPGA